MTCHPSVWTLPLSRSRAVDSQTVTWTERLYCCSCSVALHLTIDQVNIGAGTGEVHVTKHRQSAGVRPGVSHHGVVDEEAAGHEVARHLHSHTTTVQINWFNLVCGLIS